jgi:hypothetical protein
MQPVSMTSPGAGHTPGPERLHVMCRRQQSVLGAAQRRKPGAVADATREYDQSGSTSVPTKSRHAIIPQSALSRSLPACTIIRQSARRHNLQAFHQLLEFRIAGSAGARHHHHPRPDARSYPSLRNIPTISASTEHAHHAASAQQSSHRRITAIESRSPLVAHTRYSIIIMSYHYSIIMYLQYYCAQQSSHRRISAIESRARWRKRRAGRRRRRWATLRTPPALVPRSPLVAPTRYSIIMRYHYSIITHLQYCNEWAPALVQRSPLVAPTRYSIIMRGTRFMALQYHCNGDRGTRFMACAASPTCVSFGRLCSCASAL